ncbi:histone deacetylation protein RXT3 (macronuclear) [Tetrahymena thermophila SB210]|uniref:Histone deacetylation protein RXT3 n=1 Tax=Tetrahymena thermophila (strain SB210) TaxID=312017 RepID=Q22DB9_TETTS|nr:histone deacetylation protein RXT3 [Tetrahymena thermophila SB210]EAR83283.2 histone deacetylation protein RXT3 [Tetrahymena thermophila SB210]|eukprot:XP_001030946.2 histone deacetylation protein RXT3 [Tetrahymena thermophila SB210]
MSKQSEMEEIEYESSVSSNLSFLEEQPIKKSDNNSPQKNNAFSKQQKESKDKGSNKQGNNEEGSQPEAAEKEKQSLTPQLTKTSENKPTEKQSSQDAAESEHNKKKEEPNVDMEEEQPADEQEEVDEANIDEEANNNNHTHNQQKESDEENDEDKEDEDKEDEEEGQEGGNNQKDSKENDKSQGANSNIKKKGQQQSNSASQKKTQQKGKANSSSNSQHLNASKQNNNQAPTSSSSKQNISKSANQQTSNANKQSQEPSQAQNQKLNQKRNMAQRQLEEDQPKTSQIQQATQNNSLSNGNQATTPTNQTPQASQSTATQQQAPKPTKKLSSKFYLYKEGVKLPDLSEQLNQTIEVRVSKEYIHRFNKQYLSRNIWGSENYTSDSDIVCILIHHGFVKFDQPELLKDSKYAGVQVTFTVSKNRKTYISQEKNNITSRSNKAYQGYTIKPNSCNFITTLGSQEDLNRNAALMCTPVGRKKIKPNFVLQPRNILPIPEVNIIFNLSNDPAYKYSIVNFCDKSDESKDWMSHKLQTHALYIENDQDRYEISRVPEGEMNLVNEFDAYKLSRVKDPQQFDNEEMQKQSIPLSSNMVELIHTDLDWSDFKWGSNVLIIKDIEIKNLKCFKFYIKNQVD